MRILRFRPPQAPASGKVDRLATGNVNDLLDLSQSP
jgi:hypothetical protein